MIMLTSTHYRLLNEQENHYLKQISALESKNDDAQITIVDLRLELRKLRQTNSFNEQIIENQAKTIEFLTASALPAPETSIRDEQDADINSKVEELKAMREIVRASPAYTKQQRENRRSSIISYTEQITRAKDDNVRKNTNLAEPE